MKNKAFIGFWFIFSFLLLKGFTQPAPSSGNLQNTSKDTIVTLELANAQQIKTIIKNDTDRFVLVNVWATWCGPCVIVLPQLLAFHLLYGERKFEMVTLSTDVLNRKEQVKQFLEEQAAITRNFLYASTDKYALMEAIDAGWEGSLPYFVLIAPGGEVLARYAGMIDTLVVKHHILEYVEDNSSEDDN